MKRVRICAAAVVLAAGILCGMPHGHAEELHVPACSDAWCFKVALPPSSWPAAYEGAGVVIDDGPQVLTSIPAGFLKVWRSGYGIHYLYGNNRALTFNRITLDVFPDLKGISAASNFTMRDIWSTVFTGTPKDKEPANPEDALRWRWAISCMKKFYFRGRAQVFSSKNGPLTVYYHREKDGVPTVNSAVVLNEREPDVVLEILSMNFNFDLFKQIVGSITLKSVGREH